MTNLPPGFAYGMIAGQNQSIAEANRNIRRANGTIRELAEERDQKQRKIDEWRLHYVSLEAERDYLLELLDDAYSKADNPARQQAYSNPDELRIPAGPRKGEIVTKRDHAYIRRFADGFNRSLAKIYGGGWNRFMRGDIFE